MADDAGINHPNTSIHADHATWVSLPNDELNSLLEILVFAENNPCLADKVKAIKARLDRFVDPAAKCQKYRHAARHLYIVRDGECEVDDHGVVSQKDEGDEGEEGAYVMAWLWVDKHAIDGEDDTISIGGSLNTEIPKPSTLPA